MTKLEQILATDFIHIWVEKDVQEPIPATLLSQYAALGFANLLYASIYTPIPHLIAAMQTPQSAN